MKFDVGLATALLAAPKAFLPARWVDVPMGTLLTAGYHGRNPTIDRLESKFYISKGSTDKASFTLLMRVVGYRQMWRIYALDWNPTSPHINPLKPGNPFSGRVFRPGETHEHHFSERVEDVNPCGFATPVTAFLPDYNDALAYFCARVGISRPPEPPPPPAQGTLL